MLLKRICDFIFPWRLLRERCNELEAQILYFNKKIVGLQTAILNLNTLLINSGALKEGELESFLVSVVTLSRYESKRKGELLPGDTRLLAELAAGIKAGFIYMDREKLTASGLLGPILFGNEYYERMEKETKELVQSLYA